MYVKIAQKDNLGPKHLTANKNPQRVDCKTRISYTVVGEFDVSSIKCESLFVVHEPLRKFLKGCVYLHLKVLLLQKNCQQKKLKYSIPYMFSFYIVSLFVAPNSSSYVTQGQILFALTSFALLLSSALTFHQRSTNLSSDSILFLWVSHSLKNE